MSRVFVSNFSQKSFFIVATYATVNIFVNVCVSE
jgi:hypothetical protein